MCPLIMLVHPLIANDSPLRQWAGGAGRSTGAPPESSGQGVGVPGQAPLALLGAPLALPGKLNQLQGDPSH